MPSRNYDTIQHAAFRQTFDGPFTVAHDALDEAYYGPELTPNGRRSGGWRDGVERVLLRGPRGFRLSGGVMQGTTDGGGSWSDLPSAPTPDEVFRKLERLIHVRYAEAYRAQFAVAGTLASAAAADGFTQARLDALVALVATDGAAIFASMDAAIRDWKAGIMATTFAIGQVTFSVSGGRLRRQFGAGAVVAMAGTAREAMTRLVKIVKFARDRAEISARPDQSGDVAALVASGYDLGL